MNHQRLVAALEDAVERLGVRVRRERGAFRGGLCTVDGEQVLVLNRQHPPEAHLAALAEALAELPSEQLYLRPAVRVALEELWADRRGAGPDAFDAASEGA
jgi:hypothetical protein